MAGLLIATATILIAATVISSYFAVLADDRAVLAATETERANKKADEASSEAKRANDNARRADKNADEARANAAVVAKKEAEIRARLGQQYQQRGANLCASGDSHHGMLWLMRAYHTVDPGHPIRRGARRLLAGWCTEPDLTLYHPESVVSARFVEGADRIVTSCADKICLVWDAASGRTVAGPIACTDGEFCVSPASNYLVTCDPGHGMTITVRELSSGNVLWSRLLGYGIAPPRELFEDRVQFSADDRLVVLHENRGVFALDARTGKETAPPIKGGARIIRVSPDGKRALLGVFSIKRDTYAALARWRTLIVCPRSSFCESRSISKAMRL